PIATKRGVLMTLTQFRRRMMFSVRGHKATLVMVFEEPPPQLRPDKFKGLLYALNILERNGSKNGWILRLYGREEYLEKPKSDEPVGRGTVRRTRDFLKTSGLTPETVVDFLTRALPV
ncbi:MAG: hypothetical protein ACREAC_25395, partial [Blastocatellia bacterium]